MKKLPLLFLFLIASASIFYFFYREKEDTKSIQANNVYTENTSKTANSTGYAINNMLDETKSGFDYIGKLEEAISYVILGSDASYKQVDDVLRKMSADKQLSNDQKTQILWKVMNDRLIVFDYFSTFIVKLSPHIIAKDVIRFASDEHNTLLNRVNALIILVSSFDTCPKDKMDDLKYLVNSFVSPLIYNTDEEEGLYSNYIRLYKLVTGKDSFNIKMQEILSGSISKENSSVVYNELKDTMAVLDFINMVDNAAGNRDEKGILITATLKERSNSLTEQEKRGVAEYLDKHVIKLPENEGGVYSLGDITSWIEDYGYVSNKKELSIHVFSTYNRDPFLSSSLLLTMNDLDIAAIDDNTTAIKNIYSAYLANRGLNQDNAATLANALNHVFETIPALKSKYPLY